MGQKMGKKNKKGESVELTEEQLDTYIRAEFLAMDDISDKDGTLHRQEVLDLLTMLGYSKASKKLKQLHVKSEEHVALEDYMTAFKADRELVEKTMRFRQLFQLFDSNDDGTASKEEVVAGLEKVDIKVDEELQRTIEEMDTNADGKISYREFLAMEFKIAMNKGKGGKKTEEKKKKEKKKKEKKEKKSKDGSDKDSESSDSDNGVEMMSKPKVEETDKGKEESSAAAE